MAIPTVVTGSTSLGGFSGVPSRRPAKRWIGPASSAGTRTSATQRSPRFLPVACPLKVATTISSASKSGTPIA